MQINISGLGESIFEKVNNGAAFDLIGSNDVHIDTVKLSCAYYAGDLPTPNDLLDRNFTINSSLRGDNFITTAYSIAPFEKTNEPRIRIIRSENPHKYSGISVECSLAKLVNGNGLGEQTDEDIECAFDAIDDYIRQRIGVDFDARTAKVNRFDVNADFLVGEGRIGSYLEAISRPYSRLVPSTFGDSTNYYYNQSRTFVIYGKKKEMEKLFKQGKVLKEDVMKADGMLRIESRLKTRQVVKRYADKLSVEAIGSELLTKDIALKYVSKTLSQLELDTPMLSIRDREHLLIQHFGKDATEMLGLLVYREILGEDFWKYLNWSDKKFYRLRKKLKSVKLWDISPTENLPMLIAC